MKLLQTTASNKKRIEGRVENNATAGERASAAVARRSTMVLLRKAICLVVCFAFTCQQGFALELEFRGSSQRFVRGDADANGEHSLNDAVRTLNYLFNGGEELPCLDAADVNDDGDLTIVDATRFLSWRYLGSRAPAAPFPGPGFDPTLDVLGCDEFPPLEDEIDDSPCALWLEKVAETARTFDFEELPTSDPSLWSGVAPGGMNLTAHCSESGLSIIFENAEGEIAELVRDTPLAEADYEVQLRGSFPSVGRLDRSYEIADGELLREEVAAEFPGGRVELAVARDVGVERFQGLAKTANLAFQPVLENELSPWALLHRFLLRMAGTEELLRDELGAREAKVILSGVGNFAIPSSDNETQDSDQGTTNKVCTAGAAACIAGLIGVITAGACAAGGVACLAAGACQLADCSGDGHD